MKFFYKPPPGEEDRVPPGQHLAKGFPVLTYGETPQVTIDTWEFRVWGCATAKTLSWDDFMALPQQEFTADFHFKLPLPKGEGISEESTIELS